VRSWHHHQFKDDVEIVEDCLKFDVGEASGPGAVRRPDGAVRRSVDCGRLEAVRL
jgi:hypothetical protein